MIASPIAVLLSLTAASDPYHWPLDMPRQLTSSFAEYRTGRFHAGIDLRTGAIGRSVFAADDGYVSRIRCSPYGYGKAVYLALDDGNTVVYGHLDDYTDEVRAYVRAEQHAAESYTVDLYPEPGQFRVSRGDLIAKSGQTGIGAPHLHYEIRDGAQRPINPRLLGITWPDSRAPEIRKLVVSPLDAAARVNGGTTPAILDVTHLGNDRYQAAPVMARGRIAFGLDVVDADNGYRLGVHEMVLRVDEQAHFTMRHDRLSYDNHRNAVVSYHPHLLGQGRFLLLWRWPGNVCDSYGVSRNDGAVMVEDSPREIEIDVTDFMDNRAVLSLQLQPDDSTADKGTGGGDTVQWTSYGMGLNVSVTLPPEEVVPPEFLLEGSKGTQDLNPVTLKAGQFLATIAPSKGDVYTLRLRHPRLESRDYPLLAMRRGEATRTVLLGDVGLRLTPDAPYGLLMARAYPLADAPQSRIPRRGTAYRLWPDAMPVDEMIEVSLPVPGDIVEPRRADVYRSTGSSWSRQGAERRDGRFYFTTRNFGTYAVLEDDKAPTISNVLPTQGYHSQTRRPLIEATIDDVGSGIGQVDVRCDGRWLLVAYDPEHKHIAWERDEELEPGPHEVTFAITDNAGNVTTRTRSIVVPE